MQQFDEQSKAFGEQIEAELQDGRLSFPTSFDVTMRVKRLADDPASSLEDIAQVIKAEPVLSAKAVRMANTVASNPYGAQISSVSQAVARIGLVPLRCLAFAVAAEQLASDHRSHKMRLVASALWMHSVDVACWSHAIARKVGTVPPDTAMLAGMMVDIGQFFLVSRASDFPAMENEMDRFAAFVATWSEPIGRAVLETFNLPESILDAYPYETPYGGSWPPASLADIVFVAAMACESPNPFDNLLGVRRDKLVNPAARGIAKEELDTLMASVQADRQALLNAVCG